VTNYTYRRDIPASNHNPSVDQPDMRTNTNSIANLIAEDHYTFGVPNGGFHKQIRLPDLTAIGNLASRIANSGTLWTQKAISTGVTQESNLFYVPDLTNDDYQLTRTITASKALFSTNTAYYNPVDARFDGGWTFLPGGLLMQYGRYTNNPINSSDIVVYPVPFNSAAFSIQLTLTTTAQTATVVQISVTGSNSTSFSWQRHASSGSYNGFYWVAIGK
jgi:hypothetical protein